MYYLQSGYGKHDRLRNALFAALVAHAALIIGVSFDAAEGRSHNSQIEVTLATRPSSAAIEEARNIAQANQAGNNERSEPEVMPPPAPEQERPPPSPERGEPEAASADEIVSSRNAARLVNAPEVEEINRELADLEARLEDQTEAYANIPRVRRVTSVATRESQDALYLHKFLRKLEAVGNRYYPEASVRYGIYGSLRLLVVIRHDGHLEDVRVLSSSGYAVLDEAAIKTVRMSSPFDPFPADLRATTDKLEIIRTWHFEENRLSSN
jgi:protein TonB